MCHTYAHKTAVHSMSYGVAVLLMLALLFLLR
jgi:hypothetical protein